MGADGSRPRAEGRIGDETDQEPSGWTAVIRAACGPACSARRGRRIRRRIEVRVAGETSGPCSGTERISPGRLVPAPRNSARSRQRAGVARLRCFPPSPAAPRPDADPHQPPRPKASEQQQAEHADHDRPGGQVVVEGDQQAAGRGQRAGEPRDRARAALPPGELERDRRGNDEEREHQQHAGDRHREGDDDPEREVEQEIPPADAPALGQRGLRLEGDGQEPAPKEPVKQRRSPT